MPLLRTIASLFKRQKSLRASFGAPGQVGRVLVEPLPWVPPVFHDSENETVPRAANV